MAGLQAKQIGLTMYTESQIKELLRVAKDAQLSAPESFFNASVAELQSVCNGVGNDALSEKLRAILTKAFSFAESTAAIHDWEYEKSNGVDFMKDAVDDKFLSNGMKEIRLKYKWYSWRRWWAERKLIIAYRALQTPEGIGAWRSAHSQRILKSNCANCANYKGNLCAQMNVQMYPSQYCNLHNLKK